MQNTTSKLAMLQALGPLGDVEREQFKKVTTLTQGNTPAVEQGLVAPGLWQFPNTDRPFRESFIALPIFTHLMHVEWPPERARGQAPVFNHFVNPPEATPDIKGDWRMPNGNRVVKTRYLYVALINKRGQVDFNDQWAVALTSTALGFYDAEFAAHYPATITVDGEDVQGPMGSRKWKFGAEPYTNYRGQSWRKPVFTPGTLYGTGPGGLSWDELMRVAELEAEMKRADALARSAKPAQIDAKTSPSPAPWPSRGRTTIESGPQPLPTSYDPGPPEPPPPEANYEPDRGDPYGPDRGDPYEQDRRDPLDLGDGPSF